MPSEDTRPLPLGYVVVGHGPRARELRWLGAPYRLHPTRANAEAFKPKDTSGVTYTVEPVGGTPSSRRYAVSRELDARVAVEVMGATWQRIENYPGGAADVLRPPNAVGQFVAIWVERRCSDGRTIYPAGLPAYSTDIAAAWEVVEATIKRTRWRFQCGYGAGITGVPRWWAFFGDPGEASGADDHSLPLAICLAALAACAALPACEETRP